MTRSTKKRRSEPEKAGARQAVAEAKAFMTGRSQAVRLPKEAQVKEEQGRPLFGVNEVVRSKKI